MGGGSWWGWYSEVDLNLLYPHRILWTRCCSGDSYAACLARLKREAPYGRMLQVLVRDASPTLVSPEPTRRTKQVPVSDRAPRAKSWVERVPEVLSVLDVWRSRVSIAETLESTNTSTLHEVLVGLEERKLIERRPGPGPGKRWEYRRTGT